MRLFGLLLLAGAAITLTLHVLEVPVDTYHWLYDHLLSGLDVPEDPSDGSVDAVGYVSLVGGILELVAGVAVLTIDAVRRRRRSPYRGIPTGP